jgi:hypothetical protein
MSLIESNLRKTLCERIRAHERALALRCSWKKLMPSD